MVCGEMGDMEPKMEESMCKLRLRSESRDSPEFGQHFALSVVQVAYQASASRQPSRPQRPLGPPLDEFRL